MEKCTRVRFDGRLDTSRWKLKEMFEAPRSTINHSTYPQGGMLDRFRSSREGWWRRKRDREEWARERVRENEKGSS